MFVDEAHSSKNLAVVCDQGDLATLAAHALIRSEQKARRVIGEFLNHAAVGVW